MWFYTSVYIMLIALANKVSSECGVITPRVNSSTVDQSGTEPDIFPWHVLIYQQTSTGYYDQICTGTLITPEIVISAAHCFYDDILKTKLNPSSFTIAAGKYYRPYIWPSRNEQKSLAETIHLVSGYQGSDGFYAEDIAWLVLKNPFQMTSFVRPICMDLDIEQNRTELQSGHVGKVMGQKQIVESYPGITSQEMNVAFIPYDECMSTIPGNFWSFITIDKFCAKYLTGSNLCIGDSGVGLSFQRDGRWYLRGILSVSPSLQSGCSNKYPAGFTNVQNFVNQTREVINAIIENVINLAMRS